MRLFAKLGLAKSRQYRDFRQADLDDLAWQIWLKSAKISNPWTFTQINEILANLPITVCISAYKPEATADKMPQGR